ncbi:hypothetical protein TSAR_016666 [Trichomalopsis sarcophagae]|uniref:Integrase catalytic domain-containing protein n=1 Tax=Trichomalopsis sarcophagae TaxID=543379 RepID=A0A232EDK7_9HYME|nr:hypothetical protein TSAR_016666 [Trichomalopsis sarcophagae]
MYSWWALKKATSKATINRMRAYFEKVGKPERVLSDHGTQFMSGAWRDFLSQEGVQPIYCSIPHPQANPSERVMRELGKFFRMYCSETHTAWARYLPQVNYWLNHTAHSTTKYTPYELHYGVPNKNPIRDKIKFPEELPEPYAVKVELANSRTDKVHKRQKEKQATWSRIPIKDGDLVLLRVPKQSNLLERKIAKFFHLYYGPYRVLRSFNENAYELVGMDVPQKLVGRYNRADLRVYIQPENNND